MYVMSWIVLTTSLLAVLLLLYVATIDVATRVIPNEICLAVALLGVVGQLANPMQVVQSLIVAAILFLLLLALYSKRWLGGGDVKLMVAVAIGLPPTGVIQFLTVTALAGGGLALMHLAMRLLPNPALAPSGSSFLRRVYAVERWRHLRHAPLPYGVAIVCGGIWAVLNRGF
jgi:prepilin peptidase CpaA